MKKETFSIAIRNFSVRIRLKLKYHGRNRTNDFIYSGFIFCICKAKNPYLNGLNEYTSFLENSKDTIKYSVVFPPKKVVSFTERDKHRQNKTNNKKT